jgi:hypothetical protein
MPNVMLARSTVARDAFLFLLRPGPRRRQHHRPREAADGRGYKKLGHALADAKGHAGQEHRGYGVASTTDLDADAVVP